VRYYFVLCIGIAIISFSGCNNYQESNPEVLLIVGGHSFDTLEFMELFNSFENVNINTLYQPAANNHLLTDSGKNYDAYIFYDMWDEISMEEKQAYIEITEMGKPLLFLHHSIVSYQSWPEFKEIVGGRYYTKNNDNPDIVLSGYKHDLDLEIEILDKSHPIVQDLDKFTIHDEGYSALKLTQNIHPLLGTKNKDCHEILGWTNKYNNSEIVYFMLGHDKKAYENEHFRMLLSNSLSWLIE
jgi:type 1 glutamine amidotransferase